MARWNFFSTHTANNHKMEFIIYVDLLDGVQASIFLAIKRPMGLFVSLHMKKAS